MEVCGKVGVGDLGVAPETTTHDETEPAKGKANVEALGSKRSRR